MAKVNELARRWDEGHTIPVTRRPVMPGGGGHFATMTLTDSVTASTDLPAGYDGFVLGEDSDGDTVSAGYGAGLQPSTGRLALILFNHAGDPYVYDIYRDFST